MICVIAASGKIVNGYVLHPVKENQSCQMARGDVLKMPCQHELSTSQPEPNYLLASLLGKIFMMHKRLHGNQTSACE